MQILIIEPNASLNSPYSYVSTIFRQAVTEKRVTKVSEALIFLGSTSTDLVMISCSLDPRETLAFLEELKDYSREKIVPIVFVVDLEQRLSTVLGTHWGGSSAILSSLSSLSEVKAVILRVLAS